MTQEYECLHDDPEFALCAEPRKDMGSRKGACATSFQSGELHYTGRRLLFIPKVQATNVFFLTHFRLQ